MQVKINWLLHYVSLLVTCTETNVFLNEISSFFLAKNIMLLIKRLTPEHVFYGDNKEYHISQPGSSVATSLCEGEAKEKRVGILEIHGKKFKMGERKLQVSLKKQFGVNI